jgi:hypothetical protein
MVRNQAAAIFSFDLGVSRLGCQQQPGSREHEQNMLELSNRRVHRDISFILVREGGEKVRYLFPPRRASWIEVMFVGAGWRHIHY